MPRVLTVLFDDLEELEALAPIDLLRRSGANVLLASLNSAPILKGRNSIFIGAESAFSHHQDETFDAIIIPGGAGVYEALKNQDLLAFIERHANSGKIVAAICAAPLILEAAGVLPKDNFTAHFSTFDKLPNADKTAKTLVNGNIITSQGAGTAIDFALAIISKLFSPQKAQEISTSICFK